MTGATALLASCAEGDDGSGGTQTDATTAVDRTTATATETEMDTTATADNTTATETDTTPGTAKSSDLPVRGPAGEPLDEGEYHENLRAQEGEENVSRVLRKGYNPQFRDRDEGQTLVDPESVDIVSTSPMEILLAERTTAVSIAFGMVGC